MILPATYQHCPRATRSESPRKAGLSRPVVKLTVRRSHLFEDGLISLMAKDPGRVDHGWG